MSAARSPAPGYCPPKKWVKLEGSRLSDVFAMPPWRKGGMRANPFPLVIHCQTEDDAQFIKDRLGPWVDSLVELYPVLSNTTALQSLQEHEDYHTICERLNRPNGFFFDVRLGKNSGVFCSSVPAFQSINSSRSNAFRRAFIFRSFEDALLSNIGSLPDPVNVYLDYNPLEMGETVAREHQRRIVNAERGRQSQSTPSTPSVSRTCADSRDAEATPPAYNPAPPSAIEQAVARRTDPSVRPSTPSRGSRADRSQIQVENPSAGGNTFNIRVATTQGFQMVLTSPATRSQDRADRDDDVAMIYLRAHRKCGWYQKSQIPDLRRLLLESSKDGWVEEAVFSRYDFPYDAALYLWDITHA
ncbi:hypothetical protein VNI00_007304 [Paramarasmius palmivorus]|uniref:Uncharacterized protein n=1 Tax=Paramarasmius palmivorus TaxID=297713 RepID=A0AAW0D2J2_9AGAR